MKMAKQLVDSLSAKWEPDKYTDEYTANLMRVIQAKLKGKKPRLQERETPQQADVIDLMARLRASLEGKGRVSGEQGQGTRGKGQGTKGNKTKTEFGSCALRLDPCALTLAP
jgi:DNA end-binding protein Ku